MTEHERIMEYLRISNEASLKHLQEENAAQKRWWAGLSPVQKTLWKLRWYLFDKWWYLVPTEPWGYDERS